jgi:hypothetical protein
VWSDRTRSGNNLVTASSRSGKNRTSRRRGAYGPGMTRRLRPRPVLVPTALAVLLLAGCSAATSTDHAVELSSADARGGSAVGGPAVGGPAVEEAGAADATDADDRQVITSGSVALVVEDPAAAAQEASEIVEAAGGRVDERVEQAATEGVDARAHLVVRIPSTSLTEALAAVKALGEVEEVQLRETDVTDQATDLDARIESLQVSVDRLQALMAGAASTTELLSIESTLSSRQGELESLLAQRSRLAGQVALATVTLTLSSEPTVVVEAEGPDGFWPGVVAGWTALVATVSAALVVVGVLLPWVLFLGGAGLLVVVAVRWGRRRSGKRRWRRGSQAPAGQAAPATAGQEGWSQGDSNP